MGIINLIACIYNKEKTDENFLKQNLSLSISSAIYC